LVQEMNVPIVDPDTKKDRISILVDYFTIRHNHSFYAMKFFFCEFLNFINVAGQIWFMDFFLGGEFSTYGTDVLQMTELTPEEREDPMARVFPKMTKCTFHKFGPSGTVQKFDGLCVFAPEYHQRENLRFLMVLVHRFDRYFWSTNALQNDRYCVPQTQRNVVNLQIEVD